jgi:hypothetical protein
VEKEVDKYEVIKNKISIGKLIDPEGDLWGMELGMPLNKNEKPKEKNEYMRDFGTDFGNPCEVYKENNQEAFKTLENDKESQQETRVILNNNLVYNKNKMYKNVGNIFEGLVKGSQNQLDPYQQREPFKEIQNGNYAALDSPSGFTIKNNTKMDISLSREEKM